MDDWQLLNEYATRNSEEAFRTLVERYTPMVYHAALRQIGNPHVAEEVTQAVFIALAQKAGRIPKGTILCGWLFRAARYALLNLMRDEACRRRYEQEATIMETTIQPGDDSDSLWEQISPHLNDALDGLSKADREIVMVRYFGRKSHKETAQLLGISEDTAKKRLSRAMEKLRNIFTRRGVAVSSVALIAVLTAHGAQAAPVGLATTAASVALAKGAAGAASTLALAKGIVRLMAWAKAKFAITLGAGALLAAVGATTIVLNSVSASGSDVIADLAAQTGKTIVADKQLALPATIDIKNVPVEKALNQLAVQADAYWTIDFVVYDSDQDLRNLLNLLHEGSELQTGAWTNLSVRTREANITVQQSDPHGRSRAMMRKAVPPGEGSDKPVSMIVVIGPNAAFKMPQGPPQGLRLGGPGEVHDSGSPFQLIPDAMRDGENYGVLVPERLLGQTALTSKTPLSTPLPANAETAARIAKSLHCHWTTVYTLRKSPVPGAGIKLVHTGMENAYGPTNRTFGHGEAMQNMQANRFNLTPEDRAAHDRAVQAYKNQK